MNTAIKIFNYRFYVKEILILFVCYLLMEEMFSWLVAPVSAVVLAYEKIMSFAIYAFMLYSFQKLRTSEKAYLIVFSLLMIKLVLESLFKFDTFFQQPTMFYVLFPVIYAFFIKHLCRENDFDPLEFIAKFYLITYIAFMLIYGRGFSFSLDEIEMNDYGPFSGDGRIIHSSKIYMMIIPFLWYLNKYIAIQKNKFLIPLAFCAVVILVHQHRSVWSCTIFSVLIYVGLSFKSNIKSLPKIWSLLIGTAMVLGIVYFFISNMFPGFVDFLSARFGEIFDPNKQDSTGRFRADQREVYFKYFLRRPIFGWTFEGFEMSNPLVDWWPEKTGQHFHEGYMEMLFYHGIVGFVFKFSLFIFLAVKAFTKKLSQQTIVIISFCLSGLLYSFNYVLPLVFWGHMGMCLYYLEKDEATEQEEDEVEVPEIKKQEKISLIKA